MLQCSTARGRTQICSFMDDYDTSLQKRTVEALSNCMQCRADTVV